MHAPWSTTKQRASDSVKRTHPRLPHTGTGNVSKQNHETERVQGCSTVPTRKKRTQCSSSCLVRRALKDQVEHLKHGVYISNRGSVNNNGRCTWTREVLLEVRHAQCSRNKLQYEPFLLSSAPISSAFYFHHKANCKSLRSAYKDVVPGILVICAPVRWHV
jgi:hypothetical protein